MRANRLLFARSTGRAGLHPIYAAIVAVVVLAGVGCAIALWPGDADSRPVVPATAPMKSM
jgi:hypothetical protein